jgi:hypothetical protein
VVLGKIVKFGFTCLTVKVDTTAGQPAVVVGLEFCRVLLLTAARAERLRDTGVVNLPIRRMITKRIDFMSKPSLSVFPHDVPEPTSRRELELDRITGTAAPNTVSLPVGKLVPLLLQAAQNDCAWLNDFAEDNVRIDADLYDVLLAYQRMQERAA